MVRRTSSWLALAVAVVALGGPARLAAREEKTVDLWVVGGTELQPGTRGSLLVETRQPTWLLASKPIAGAAVFVHLLQGPAKVKELFRGTTDERGVVEASYDVPAWPEGSYELLVKTTCALGAAEARRAVTLRRTGRLLLVSDKPLYQPGQVVHLRALALDARGLTPLAKEQLRFEVSDPKGNKVFKELVTANDFGVAATTFRLADEVNLGEYQLDAVAERQGAAEPASKTVVVKKYVLPKFKVELETERPWYQPGEVVKGSLRADYFFGKPVAGAEVELQAATFDAEFREFATLKGVVEEDGRWSFEVKVPDHLVGQDFQKGAAVVKLEATVRDTARHVEKGTRTVPVSPDPIRLDAVPEGGRLVAGVENALYLVATYPDGSAAKATVTARFGDQRLPEAITDDAGLAEVRFTPPAGGPWALRFQAKDQRGATCDVTRSFAARATSDRLLLRVDRALYRAGDVLQCELLTTEPDGVAFLDVVKGKQTALTRTVAVAGGRGSLRLPLGPDLFGTLEIHGYTILKNGELMRDARVVYVNPPSDLKVTATADKDVYRPGERATLRFKVQDGAGAPRAAALGVVVVDEAVYALQDLQPGLEKVYFTLERELANPKYEIEVRAGTSLDALIRTERLEDQKQRVAKALLAQATPSGGATLWANPAAGRVQQAWGELQRLWSIQNQMAAAVAQHLRAPGAAGTPLPALLRRTFEARAGKAFRWEDVRDLPGFQAADLAAGLHQAKAARVMAVLAEYGKAQRRRANQTVWDEARRAFVFPSATVAKLVRADLLKEDESLDVWGRPLRVREPVLPDGAAPAALRFVELYSVGPDGQDGTADDLPCRSSDPNQTYRRLCVAFGLDPDQGPGRWGWGRRRDMLEGAMLGGGAEDFAGPGATEDRGGMVRAMAEAAPPPMPAVMAQMTGAKSAAGGAGGGGAPPRREVRVREYFPETLLFEPSLIADERGEATLEVALADSITTWRLSASANGRAGGLGGATRGLRVFQDFFVDLDLPVALTQNDEVSIPVVVYNYLKKDQLVRLELERADWFELQGGTSQELRLEPGEVRATAYRLKVKGLGRRTLQVRADGTSMSDALKRDIEVLPDGKEETFVANGRLDGAADVAFDVPGTAVPGASKILVRLYPGVFSQIVEGMDAMLQLPGG